MAKHFRWLERKYIFLRQLQGVFFYFFILLVISVCFGIFFYHSWIHFNSPVVEIDPKIVKKLKQELQTKTAELESVKLAVNLAKKTNLDLQDMFTKQLENQNELEKELAFYRSIMTVKNSNDVIYNVELIKNIIPRQYRLIITLTQPKNLKNQLKGYVDVKLLGELNHVPHAIKLDTLSKDKIDFSFRYFQVLEPQFILPKNFMLKRVLVRVVIPKTRTHRGKIIEQVYGTNELTNKS